MISSTLLLLLASTAATLRTRTAPTTPGGLSFGVRRRRCLLRRPRSPTPAVRSLPTTRPGSLQLLSLRLEPADAGLEPVRDRPDGTVGQPRARPTSSSTPPAAPRRQGTRSRLPSALHLETRPTLCGARHTPQFWVLFFPLGTTTMDARSSRHHGRGHRDARRSVPHSRDRPRSASSSASRPPAECLRALADARRGTDRGDSIRPS